MSNYIVIFWWYSITKYSIHNVERLYYIRNYITLENKENYIASYLYIFACLIRSCFPRIDGKRICFFDSWISYPLVGRILATIGELAFGYQLTLVTQSFAQRLNCYKIYHLMDIIMNLIFIAQIFCWGGVLFQNNLMHVFEESIWMFSMTCIGLSYLYFNNFVKNIKTRNYFYLGFVISYIYMMFMVWVDIPMYYNRYLETNSIINTNLSLFESIKDMASCYKISKSYNDWKSEMPWMTGYFIGATFISINLMDFQELPVN